MTYQDASILYSNTFGLKSLPVSGRVKLELINLICFIVVKTGKKITPYEFLVNQVYKNDKCIPIHEVIAISCICNELLYQCENGDFNNYGYKTGKELMERVKSILDDTLPF